MTAASRLRSRSPAGPARLLILLAYLLLSAGRLTGQSLVYQGMNVVGAAGFVINGWWHGAIAVRVAQRALAADRSGRVMADREEKRIVDLSHVIEDGMTTYKGLPGPHICDFWAREGSAANYDDGSTFQIGRIDMVANTGTYLDSPFHRYADGKRPCRRAAGVACRPAGHRRPAAVGERTSRSMPAAFDGLDVARQGGAGAHRLGPPLADGSLLRATIRS